MNDGLVAFHLILLPLVILLQVSSCFIWSSAKMAIEVVAVSLFCAAASIMVSSAFMDSLPTRLGEHALPGRPESLGNRENALKKL